MLLLWFEVRGTLKFPDKTYINVEKVFVQFQVAVLIGEILLFMNWSLCADMQLVSMTAYDHPISD